MAWQLLAAAIPTVAKLATTAINKPKESDFKPQTKYMEKYLANLRGQQSSNAVFEQAMRPALRTIGAQSRQQQQQIGYNVQRSGLAGSGIEAQQRLTASQGTQEALAGATERAASAQTIANQQLGREAMKVSSQIEMERERAAQAYDQAMTQYDRNLKGIAVEGLANVATAGVGMAMTNQKLTGARKILGDEQVDQFLTTMTDEEIIGFAQKIQKDNYELYGDNQGAIEDAINQGVDIFKENDSASVVPLVKQVEDIDLNDLSNLASDVADLPEDVQSITTQNPSSTSSKVAQQGSEAVSPTASPPKTTINNQEIEEMKNQWNALSKSAKAVFESVGYSMTNTGVGLTGEPEVWDEVLKSYIRIKGNPTGNLDAVNDFSSFARENYEKIKKGMGG